VRIRLRQHDGTGSGQVRALPKLHSSGSPHVPVFAQAGAASGRRPCRPLNRTARSRARPGEPAAGHRTLPAPMRPDRGAPVIVKGGPASSTPSPAVARRRWSRTQAGLRPPCGRTPIVYRARPAVPGSSGYRRGDGPAERSEALVACLWARSNAELVAQHPLERVKLAHGAGPVSAGDEPARRLGRAPRREPRTRPC